MVNVCVTPVCHQPNKALFFVGYLWLIAFHKLLVCPAHGQDISIAYKREEWALFSCRRAKRYGFAKCNYTTAMECWNLRMLECQNTS